MNKIQNSKCKYRFHNNISQYFYIHENQDYQFSKLENILKEYIEIKYNMREYDLRLLILNIEYLFELKMKFWIKLFFFLIWKQISIIYSKLL